MFAYLVAGGLRELLPALYVLGRADSSLGVPALRFASPLVALLTACAAAARLASGHPPLPEYGQLMALIELDDVEKTFTVMHRARPRCAADAPRCGRSTA